MSKYTLSTTVDTTIINLLDRWGNKSQIVNRILNNALQTEDGINELIEDTKTTLKRLEATRDKIKEKKQKQFENISEELKVFLIGGFKTNEEGQRVEEQGVKTIIEKHPDKLTMWAGIINKRFNTMFNPEELKELIRRLSE